jgi:single-strand DNA-binding protein
MANLNKVLLMGNLTRDPELRYTPKGTAVADIALAINRVWFDDASNQKKEEVTFVDITLWGRQAELAQQYLVKGRGCFVEGRLQMDTWEDKATGQKRSRLKVVAESLQFLPDGKGGAAAGNGSTAHGMSQQESSARARETQTQREQREAGGDHQQHRQGPPTGGTGPNDYEYREEDDIPF